MPLLKRYIYFLIVLTISLPCVATQGAGQPNSPNVIFILTDDLGYSDVSSYGAQKVNTPNIDQLASQGLKFTNFHTAASICSPSRAAFLTGAYPQRSGLYMGINPNREAHWFLGLHPDEITLAEQFKKQGYKTMMVGKWHLGTQDEFSYYRQGFDNYYGMPSNYGHSPRFFDERELVYEKTPLDKLTQLYTDRITQYIDAQKDNPFFLYYSHNYPHTPYRPGEQFKGTSDDGIRGDIIQELDWSVGQIIKTLEQHGMAENTLIIFTSDNGPVANRYAQPLRGRKFTSMEGGHRVPFILHWEEKIRDPKIINEWVTAMDVFPTLSQVIGEPLPSDRTYDGVSLVPLFDNKQLQRKDDVPFAYYNAGNLQAIRYKHWKLHLPRTAQQTPWWDKGPVIDEPRLYDLAVDSGEEVDLAESYPGVVDNMTKMANQFRQKLGAYKQRGSQQRPTGSLFPEVPVITNPTDWNKLSDHEKGKGKTEFDQ